MIRTKTNKQVQVGWFFVDNENLSCFEFEASILTQICAIHLLDAKLSLKLFFLPMFAILFNAKFHYWKLKPAVPSFISPICSKIFAKKAP